MLPGKGGWVLRVVAWPQGGVHAALGPIPPPPSEESRADQWWDQICGGHELCLCLAAGDTIALPPSRWGNVHTWEPPAFRQASLDTRGWSGEGESGKKHQIVLVLCTANFHVRLGALGTSSLVSELWGVWGCDEHVCSPGRAA